MGFRYPPTDEVFFVQNAGAKASGTGLNKSNRILKISLAQAAAVSGQRNASGQVDVVNVTATPPVINSNGKSLREVLGEAGMLIILQEEPTTGATSFLLEKARATTHHPLYSS
jgi:hypothetical protein